MADEKGGKLRNISEAIAVRKATLEKLADIKITQQFSINLRVLLEPIGLLRIIVIILSMFAFSLTAGFTSYGSSNQITCDNSSNATYTATVSFSYPFRPSSFRFLYNPTYNTSSGPGCATPTIDNLFSGAAEFYVFMSVITFLLGILALVVYVIFYVPRYDIAKYISLIDFCATAVVVFFYFIADIAWSAGATQLSIYIGTILNSVVNNCLPCNSPTSPNVSIQSFVQTNFSLLFGWVATIVLIASLWFTYKDTIVHLNQMGPLYKMSLYKKLSKTQRYSEGRTQGTEEEEDVESPREVALERPNEGTPSGGGGWEGGKGWDD